MSNSRAEKGGSAAPGEQSAADKRVASRKPTVRNAVLSFAGEQRPCSVRDISPGGARIILRDTADIPRSVQLTLTADRVLYNAVVARRTETELGLSFESGPFAVAERPDTPMQHFRTPRRS